MNNLQQDFLKQSIENLENLIGQLQKENSTGAFSENFSRQSFRTLHTIKGTAQTFGFPVSGNLAHQLENLLSVVKNGQIYEKENCKSLLLDGLELLKKTFKQKNVEIPPVFFEKLKKLAPRENDSAIQTPELPARLFSQLSNREKNVVLSAEQTGKNLFCLEIDFELTKFAEGITNFRDILSEKCEIIATLPGRTSNAPGKINFQILLATAESAENIKSVADRYSAEIVFEKPQIDFSNDLQGVFGQVVAHGENLADRLGKAIDFEGLTRNEKIPPGILQIIFDALIHLTRNAVDHAIELPEDRVAKNKSARGAVKIQFFSDENNYRLTVNDDGRGIDREKIREKAVKKKIVSDAGSLSDQAALDLIFAPEFSTAERLTEISGRGVGLDAVKDSIEKAGGKIKVSSRPDVGTIFEISLPREF